MSTAAVLHDDLCGDCLASHGLCTTHAKSVLPQLARNIGWLKLMGEAQVEQKARQLATDQPLPESPEAQQHAKRKQIARLSATARKASKRGHLKGYAGLYLAIGNRKQRA